jgi:hypothetical protein
VPLSAGLRGEVGADGGRLNDEARSRGWSRCAVDVGRGTQSRLVEVRVCTRRSKGVRSSVRMAHTGYWKWRLRKPPPHWGRCSRHIPSLFAHLRSTVRQSFTLRHAHILYSQHIFQPQYWPQPPSIFTRCRAYTNKTLDFQHINSRTELPNPRRYRYNTRRRCRLELALLPHGKQEGQGPHKGPTLDDLVAEFAMYWRSTKL